MISSKATGVLGQLRKGAGDLPKLATQYGSYDVSSVVQGNRNDQRFVVLTEGGDSKKRKQMEMRKEDGGWKVLAIN